MNNVVPTKSVVITVQKNILVKLGAVSIPELMNTSGMLEMEMKIMPYFSIFKTHNIQSIGIIHALCINHLISYDVGW